MPYMKFKIKKGKKIERERERDNIGFFKWQFFFQNGDFFCTKAHPKYLGQAKRN
jgi:hypothetical protein